MSNHTYEVSHNDTVYAGFTVAELEAAQVPQALIDAAVQRQAALDARAGLRGQIEAQTGDTLSLLGTASDGAQLLLFHFATLVQALSTANSLADVREAAAPFAPLAGAFLAQVDAGTVRLPFQLKGEAEVLAEIETRATAVTDALSNAQQGG